MGPIAALFDLLGIGTDITVDLTSTTTFSVSDTDAINLSGLGVTFDANSLGNAQRVDAAALHQVPP